MIFYLGGYRAEPAGSGAGPAVGRIGVVELRDGSAELRSTVECPADPSYLAVAPGGQVLYAVHELEHGLVSAFSIGTGGVLRLLGTRSSGGAHPCHLAVHPDGRHLLTANYGSGSFAVHPVGADGSLGAATDVLDTPQPHAHMILPDPAGRWVLGVHLGTGTVTTFALDADAGRLRQVSQASMRPGAGPRHAAFHPAGTTLYVANELDSTVTECGFDPASGRVAPGDTVSTLPAGTTTRNYPSAIRVRGDGRFVYVANRLHDSVAVLATAPRLGLVATYPAGGHFPRDVAFAPDGRFLVTANERADLVAGLPVDPADGSLAPAAWTVAFGAPTCIAIR